VLPLPNYYAHPIQYTRAVARNNKRPMHAMSRTLWAGYASALIGGQLVAGPSCA
jgi:hypothetical protein